MPNVIMSYLNSKDAITPGAAGSQFWALVYVFIIFAGVSVAVMAMNWLERKALAHFQIRLGPMRVGPHGLLQPIADAIKLMLKEDIIPAEADQFVFWVAPLIGLLAAFAVYTVIPFGPSQAVSDMNIGILFMLGVSSLGVLGIVVAGWASNSHYPLIGALRSSAQMVSYEVAMGLAVVSAILMTSLNATGTGTLSMIGIVQAQQQQGVWFIFKFFPLGLIAFGIFAIALIAVALWLGGWMRPFPNLLHGPAWDFIFSLFPSFTFLGLAAIAVVGTVRMPAHSFFRIQRIGLAAFAAVLGFIALLLLVIAVAGRSTDASVAARFRDGIDYVYWFVFKVAIFMYLFIWYRATWPRYRFDQLMKIGWKVMLPISLVVLIATAIVGVLVS